MAVTKTQAKKALASPQKKRVGTSPMITRSKSATSPEKQLKTPKRSSRVKKSKTTMKSPKKQEKIQTATLSIATRSKSGKIKNKEVTLDSDAEFAILGKCYVKQLEKSNPSKKVASPKKTSPKKVASPKKVSPIKGTSIIKKILKENPNGLNKSELARLTKAYDISIYTTNKIISELIKNGEVTLIGTTGRLILVEKKSLSKPYIPKKKSPTKEENFKRNIVEAILGSKGKKMTKLTLLKNTNIDNDMLTVLLDNMVKNKELEKVKQSYIVLKNNYSPLSPKDIEDIIFEKEKKSISKTSPTKSFPIKGSPIRSSVIPELTRSQTRDVEKIFGIFEENQSTEFTIQNLINLARDEYEIPQNVLDSLEMILDILVKEGRVNKKKGKPVKYVISDEYRFEEDS